MKKTLLLIVLTVAFTGLAFAQSDIGLKGIGGGVGYIDPDGIESTFGFFGRADLGNITPKIGLNAEVLYWSKSYSEEGFGYSWEWTYSTIYITALGIYNFGGENSQFKPYAVGGVGLALAKASSESNFSIAKASMLSSSTSDTELSLHIGVGANYALSDKLTGKGEFRYVLTGGDFWGVLVGVMYSMD